MIELGFAIREQVWAAFVLSPIILGAAARARSCLSRTGWYATWVLISLLSLVGTWHQGLSDEATIGGLIPVQDAGEYYTSARRLIEGVSFSDISSSRPLAPGFLSFVVWLFRGDLRFTLVLFCLVWGLSACLFVEQCRKSVGNVAAVCSGTLVFVFYNRFISTTGTEQLGLIFSLIGTALLLHSVGSRDLRSACFGLFLLTLALIARAGAFFVLPALAIWTAVAFTTVDRFSWRNLAIAVLAIASAFCLNWILLKTIANADQPPFGNFAFTLFGLVTGGQGWTAPYAAHPELVHLPLNERCREIYLLAWQEFCRRPHLAVLGALRYIVEFVKPTGYGMFGFVVAHRFTSVAPWGIERAFNVGTRTILMGLVVLGIRYCSRHWRPPLSSLLLFAAAGIVTSLPFVPPIDTDQSRAYAATIPLLAVIASVGIEAAIARFHGQPLVLPPHVESRGWRWSAVLGAALVAASIGGPVLVKFLAIPNTVLPTACPAGQTAHYIRWSTATGVRLTAPDAASKWRIGSVQDGLFGRSALPRVTARAGVHGAHDSREGSLLDVLDLVDGTSVFLILPDALTPNVSREDDMAAVCGVNSIELGYPVFDVRSIHPAKVPTSRSPRT